MQVTKNDLDIIKEFKKEKQLQQKLKAKFSKVMDLEIAVKIIDETKKIIDLIDQLKVIPEDWYDHVRRDYFFDLIYYNERIFRLTSKKIFPHQYLDFTQQVYEYFFEREYDIPSDPLIDLWKKEMVEDYGLSVDLILKYNQKAIDLINEDEKFTDTKYVRYDIIGNLYLEQFFITLKYSTNPEKKYLEKASEYYKRAKDLYEYTKKPIRTMKYLKDFINYLAEELDIIDIYKFNLKMHGLRKHFPEFFKN